MDCNPAGGVGVEGVLERGGDTLLITYFHAPGARTDRAMLGSLPEGPENASPEKKSENLDDISCILGLFWLKFCFILIYFVQINGYNK